MLIKKIVRKSIFILRRIKNQRHRYDYPPTNNEWKKIGQHPIISGTKNNSFFDPFFLQIKGINYLFVSDRGRNAIVRYQLDGFNKAINPVFVLFGIKDTWLENVNRCSIVKHDDLYFMWFTGQKDDKSNIGLAISSDGIHYELKQDTPVLCANGTTEGFSVMNPCVIFDEQDKIFKMWYSSGENYEPDYICYATSIDGFFWKKYESNPVLRKKPELKYMCFKVGGCEVKKINNKYFMWFIGYQNLDVARICMAQSNDGTIWEPCVNNPIISPSKRQWDADAVYKPTIYYEEKNNVAYLWYNGRHKYAESIGIAEFNKKIL